MADFSIVDGVVGPKIFIINTRDSAIWLDASASLPAQRPSATRVPTAAAER